MKRAPRSYLESLIFAVARAREREKKARKEESFFYTEYGTCPDDEIIYETYESWAELSALKWALECYRAWNGKKKP